MSARFSQVYGAVFTYEFWLVFRDDGAVRLSRGQPSCGRDERAMSCTAKLPRSLFTVPSLKATINLSDSMPDGFKIDIEAAGEALRQTIGCDIDLKVVDSRE